MPCCLSCQATIAKRRSYANTISYLTPPAENAGLYKGLKELKELISSYQGMRESGRAEQVRGEGAGEYTTAERWPCWLLLGATSTGL